MTVYKAIKKEADAASGLAISLIKGDKAGADSLASRHVEDTETGEQVPSVLLQPEAITKDNVKTVIDDGFVDGRGRLHATRRSRRPARSTGSVG